MLFELEVVILEWVMGVRAMSDAVSYAGGGDVLIPTRRHVPYCRREKSGYYSLIGNNGSSSFSMINETAREIIELCDGRKTLGEIFACLRDEYPDAQAETIKRDLFNSIDVLYGLRIIGFENKMDAEMNKLENIDSVYSVWIADEEDLPEITSYMRRAEKRQAGVAYCWGEDLARYFDSVNVRRKLFDFSSDCFLLKRADDVRKKAGGEISALIEIEYPTDIFVNSAYVNLVVGDCGHLGSLLRVITKYLRSCRYRSVNSIRIRIPKVDEAYLEDTLSAYLEAGFELEAIQRREYGTDSSDLSIYVLHI